MKVNKYNITQFVKPLNTILRKNKRKWSNDDWFYIMEHLKLIIIRLNEIEKRPYEVKGSIRKQIEGDST